MPAESGMVTLPYFDKILHGFEFFFFALLFFLSLPNRGKSYLHLSVVIIVSAVYGGFIELYQSRIPTRSMSIADWYADLIGVFLASFIWLYVKKYVNSRWPEENR
jgi:VanZ family protein